LSAIDRLSPRESEVARRFGAGAAVSYATRMLAGAGRR